MKHYIYILIDPRDNRLRYVGKTVNIQNRYDAHCTKQRGNHHRANWLNQLYFLGLKPVMQIIEECNEDTWANREIFWIKYYRDLGCDLVNETNGGEGVTGHSWTPNEKQRLKMSEAKKGKSFTEDHKNKIREANKGKTLSEDHKRKISEATRGKTRDESFRYKLSEANKGEKNPHYGKPLSAETRQKISDSHKGKNNKLTEQQVREIKYSSLKQNKLALLYGVCTSTISRIKRGKQWLHIK